MTDEPTRAPVDVATRPLGGRPRGAATVVVSVRLSVAAYDRYVLRALRARVPVRTVMRVALETHASRSFRSPSE